MSNVPTFDQMMNPLLQAVRELGGSGSIEVIDGKVIELMELTDEQVGVPHNDDGSKSEVSYRLAWTRTYLKKYGLLQNAARGVWALTEEGWQVDQVDPAAVKRTVNSQRNDEPEQTKPGDHKPTVTDPNQISETTEVQVRSLTPGLPDYDKARHFLRIMDGVPYSLYRSTYNEIWEHRGSPQEQVDWSDPEEWIPSRLTGEEAKLAYRVWRESNGELNPRYLRGSWYLTTKHDLLKEDKHGVLRITDEGEQFLQEQDGKVIADIDAFEGVLTILRLVAERGPGQRSDFLPEYADFCRTHTRYQSDTPIRGSLYDRLTNLIARGYVARSGQVYEVTETGLAYLERYADMVPGQPVRSRSTRADLRRLAKQMRQEAREQLADHLAKMDPFKFEELVKFLLEEMGYRDVITTAPVNDKGVDVVADIDLGISSVREVVQVKRLRGTVGRRVLDQLRGSLHRFDAVRGTIITTGGFTRGTEEAAFERGAAPITLIDGEKLLDLLVAHEIGVSKQTVDYLEFDESKLQQFETQEAEPSDV